MTCGRSPHHPDLEGPPADREPARHLEPARVVKTWRLTFETDGEEIADVDLEDYH